MRWTRTIIARAQAAAIATSIGIFAATPMGVGCIEGGSNANQHNPGNEPDGVLLSYGDIAIDPTGSYFLYEAGDQLAIGDLTTGDTKLLPGVEEPIRVAFASNDNRIFVAVAEESSQTPYDALLLGYDPIAGEKLWEIPAEEGSAWNGTTVEKRPGLQVTDDGDHLVVVNVSSVQVIDPTDGTEIFEFDFDYTIVDVDLVAGEDRIFVTLATQWSTELPSAQIVSASLVDGTTATVVVPNCASELVIETSSMTGYLAPDSCNQDPVSVIDLANLTWQRNLPGFGPVALAPGGDVMVAFMDTDNVDDSLFGVDDPRPDASVAQYHLMLIDAATLSFEILPLGDTLPRYTMTPDGDVLLVDSPSWFTDGRLRLLDLSTRTFRETTGVEVRLENFVITSDGAQVFSLQESLGDLSAGLFEILIADATVSEVELSFLPTNLNITADDSRLLLREDDETIGIYAIAVPDAPLVEIDLTIE